MRRGRAHVGAGFERAWSAGAELGVLYGITSGGARKAKIFSGARAEAALAKSFLCGGARAKMEKGRFFKRQGQPSKKCYNGKCSKTTKNAFLEG